MDRLTSRFRNSHPQASVADAEAFAASALALARALRADSLALRSLVLAVPAEGWDQLPQTARNSAAEMLEQHLAALSRNLTQLSAVLKPDLAASPVPAGPFPREWRGLVLALALRVDALTEQMQTGYAGTGSDEMLRAGESLAFARPAAQRARTLVTGALGLDGVR